MCRFEVEGKRQLNGEVWINGAKNSALKIMAASLLGHGTFKITDVPKIRDVITMCGVLNSLGVHCKLEPNCLELKVNSLHGRPPQELAKSMRASVQIMGPMLAKLGRVEVARPGGCAIGSRPLDLHLAGFQRMGAVIDVSDELISARAKRLRGADLTLRFPSVGATENIMMAATLAQGETIIRNAAREPEIVDIQSFLNKMGARVTGAGTPVIRIKGVRELGAVDFRLIPDRIEAGTYLLAGLITGGSVTLRNVVSAHLAALLRVVEGMGAEIEEGERSLTAHPPARLAPFNVVTSPYPGFPTDLQPQLAALATQAAGTSLLTESIFDSRFGYLKELAKLGAKLKVEGRTAAISGGLPLEGAAMTGCDLRAGAALVLAALAAEGLSVIDGVGHIERGYEAMEVKLAKLGAKIKRVCPREGLDEE
ncbi:MAG TPA: UDP-N-acetylglucosamine 1-carboxyvinyltransferase [Firmicutes bacterium]|nr:UDP-N-acetylglucosamine 1-carboxyvinyltransferase [Bacillota bacterium]